MKKIRSSAIILLSFLLVSCSRSPDNIGEKINHPPHTVRADTENSVYQSGGTWTNQDGQPVSLEMLSGKVQVAAMIFTTCGYACPKIVHNMQEIEKSLPAAVRKETRFLLISFDAENDTAGRLKQYADHHALDGNWTLLHGAPDEVRSMSMLLNVKYTALPGGGFNHVNVITILDKTGNIYKQITGLDINIDDAVKAIGSAGRL